MATIHSFAPEILSNIFELAHNPHTPSTMKSAALVCRAWRGPAQRTLFLDIAVPVFLYSDDETKMQNSPHMRWEVSTRPYPPRRVELLVNPKRVEPRTSLPWITGVKNLTISGESIPSDLLSDPNLEVLDVSIILMLPNINQDLVPAMATVPHLHHLTIVFARTTCTREYMLHFFETITGSLPASIKRLSLKNARGAPDPNHLALFEIPLPEIQELFWSDRLPNLRRIDFPDCKRTDLEDDAAGADLLDECERQSIRVVCWEEFI